jgi:hypothetical protein
MSADLTEWNSNALVDAPDCSCERAVSIEEIVASLLMENERLREAVAILSAEAATSRAKLANATATLAAIATI